MSFNCDFKNNCSVFSLIASAIIGIVAAFLRITAVITLSDAFLWVLFGVAVVYLAVLLVSSSLRSNRYCCNISLILAGILGTILLSIILLGIDFVATSVVGAITVGLLLFFFSLAISETACLVRSFAACDRNE